MLEIQKELEATDIKLFAYDDINFGRVLGEGISTVYHVTVNGSEFAGKHYENDGIEDILYEIQTFKKLKGTKQCVKLMGISYNDYNVVLLMEVLKSVGDVQDYLQQDKLWVSMEEKNNEYGIYNYSDQLWWKFLLPENEKIKITLSLIDSVKELHEKGIIHGDLKTNNIFYHNDDIVKLLDFGMSYHHSIQCYQDIDIPVRCGTHGYMAPEQYSYKLSYKSDIYSLAVTLVELWNGEIWIEEDSNDYKICRNEVLRGIRTIEKNHEQFGKLLRRCLSVKKTLRPSIIEFQKETYNMFSNNDHIRKI
tara:strand:- start:155 stop:1072 length:918 start_codon:yes stop_codon:yes gene_type:complete